MRTLIATIEVEYTAHDESYKTDNPVQEDLAAYDNNPAQVIDSILAVGNVTDFTIKEK